MNFVDGLLRYVGSVLTALWLFLSRHTVSTADSGLKSELETIRQKLGEARAEREYAEEETVKVRSRLKLTDDHISRIRDLETTRTSFEVQLQQTSSLLASRSLELQAAQAFLSTTDTLSGAQAIQEIEDLNSEIQQTAAIISESFGFTPLAELAGESRTVANGLTQYLGNPLVSLLKTHDHAGDPTIVQIALQTALVAYSAAIANRWSLDLQNAEDDRMWKLYHEVRSSEVQTVVGRWRALTSRHLRLLSRNSKASLDQQSDVLMRIISSVVVAAGCSEAPWVIESTRGAPPRRGYVQRSLRHFSPKSSVQGAMVVCTVDLGLRQTTKIGNTLRNYDKAANIEVILLKPKVVLNTSLATL